MNKKLEEQLKAMLWDLGHTKKDAQNIIDFIDQNYISKSEVKEKIDKIQKDCNNSVGIIDGNTALHQLKKQLGL